MTDSSGEDSHGETHDTQSQISRARDMSIDPELLDDIKTLAKTLSVMHESREKRQKWST